MGKHGASNPSTSTRVQLLLSALDRGAMWRSLCAVLVALLACLFGLLTFLVDPWITDPPRHHQAGPINVGPLGGSLDVVPLVVGIAVEINRCCR